MKIRHGAVIILSAAVSLALSGCARSPQVSFYTLAPMEKQAAAPAAPAPFSVYISPVTLPEFAERPQLVVSTGGPRVFVQEMHRWAEPLKNSIPRVMADNLSRLLASERVSFYPQSGFNDSDFRIVADFQRFESSDDAVQIEARWTVKTTSDPIGKARQFRISENVGGEGNELRVAAYNRALAAFSREIAASLRNGL